MRRCRMRAGDADALPPPAPRHRALCRSRLRVRARGDVRELGSAAEQPRGAVMPPTIWTSPASDPPALAQLDMTAPLQGRRSLRERARLAARRIEETQRAFVQGRKRP